MKKIKNLLNIYRRQGGKNIIKGFIRSHVLFTALNQFLVIGYDKTALEILRLSVALKIKKTLVRRYKATLDIFDKEDRIDVHQESSKKVWICWLQGIEMAPDIVKRCFQSVKDSLPDREIILINNKNINEYVNFPDFIMEKWKNGIITNTHFTDLLRLELLIKYGGTWIDATVFCSGGKIPDYYFESDLFFYQYLKPGLDGHSIVCSSWFITAKKNNKILRAVRCLCYKYWKENNYMIDYFLFHNFLTIVLERYPERWKKIIPCDNSEPHILLLNLFEQYDDEIWGAIKEQTPFHKLTYKFDEYKTKIPGTYYEKIMVPSKCAE